MSHLSPSLPRGTAHYFRPADWAEADSEEVPAVPIHADCALRGAKTPLGEIARIEDGDASTLLVVTADGKGHTLVEAGFEV